MPRVADTASGLSPQHAKPLYKGKNRCLKDVRDGGLRGDLKAISEVLKPVRQLYRIRTKNGVYACRGVFSRDGDETVKKDFFPDHPIIKPVMKLFLSFVL